MIRMPYQYELDWIEGGLVDHVYRMVNGLPLYCEPTVEYVPFVYTPLFFYLSTIVAFFTGVGFLPLRLVSFACSILSMLLLYSMVHRETRSRFASLLTIGIYCSCFAITGALYDTGRVDSLVLFLILMVFYLYRYSKGLFFNILIGFTIVAAFLTKQYGITIFIPLIIYSIIVNWKRGLTILVSTIVFLVGITYVQDIFYHGWYSYWTLILPFFVFNTTYEFSRLLFYWTQDIMGVLPISLLMMICYFIFTNYKKENNQVFYLIIALSLILGSMPNRLILYGVLNAVTPTYVALALMTGLSISKIYGLINNIEKVDVRNRITIFILSGLIIQFAMCLYSPRVYIPTQNDILDRNAIVTMTRNANGDVFNPCRGYYNSLAEKNTSAHLGALIDIIQIVNDPVGEKLRNEFIEKIQKQEYSMMVLNKFWIVTLPDMHKIIEQYYYKPESTKENMTEYVLKNGKANMETYIYMPKNINN